LKAKMQLLKVLLFFVALSFKMTHNVLRLGVVAVNLAQKFNSSTNVEYSTNVQ